MIEEEIKAFGRRAFSQSIKPLKENPRYADPLIIGLDTEYFEGDDGRNTLVSWQIGWDMERSDIYTTPLTLESLCKKLPESATEVFIATFFVTAEAQFFLTNKWKVSEYKGKYSFDVLAGNVNIHVLDVSIWFQKQGLKDVAPIFGLQKLEFDIVTKMAEYKEKRKKLGKRKADVWLLSDKEFVDYAVNDAVVTGEIFRRMREIVLSDYDVDLLHFRTPAATSGAAFRLRYVQDSIGNTDWPLRIQSLKSCWGGRSECFYRGMVDEVYTYDASAHHPSSCMALGVLPREREWIQTFKVDDLSKAISGICKVAFKFPNDARYPCLPVVSGSSLIFPLTGQSDCTVSEVKLALDMGADITILKCWVYDRGTDIVQRFFAELMEKRKQSKNTAESVMFKLLMNSIVGKLFQKNRELDLQKVRDYAEKNQIPVEVALDVVKSETRYTTVGSMFYPEWYALILGRARANIGRLAWEKQALMISSDSVVLRQKLDDSFMFDGVPYKKEKQGQYVAYRAKFYRVGEKLAHHALHDKNVASTVLKEILDIDSVDYEKRHIVKLRESYRRHLSFGSTVTQHMSASLDYDYKRILLDDGSTIPWKSSEERESWLERRKHEGVRRNEIRVDGEKEGGELVESESDD